LSSAHYNKSLGISCCSKLGNKPQQSRSQEFLHILNCHTWHQVLSPWQPRKLNQSLIQW